MPEKMKQFLELLAKDEALQEKMANSKSPEEAFAVAKSVSDVDQAEFIEVMNKIRKMADQMNGGELSDEDLDMVAGGWSDTDTSLTLTIVSTVIAAASSAASF